MRDLQHWKDKVELSLDGRQVFFLFFGGAVLACMLFALGVMTGRRLEARAIALESPSTEDPLAALDQLGDLEEEELTYHRALTRDAKAATHKDTAAMTDAESPSSPHAKPAAITSKPTVPPALRPAVPAQAHAITPADGEDEVVAEKPAALPKPPIAVARPAAATVAGAVASAALPKAPVVAVKPAVGAPKMPAPAKPATVTASVKPAPKPAASGALKSDAKEPTAEVAPVHFTLQLSAFAARHDADDFSRRVQAAGYHPFVVASDVPGKGVVYRVRIGDYGSKDIAITEKAAIEKKLKVSAYLAKL